MAQEYQFARPVLFEDAHQLWDIFLGNLRVDHLVFFEPHDQNWNADWKLFLVQLILHVQNKVSYRLFQIDFVRLFVRNVEAEDKSLQIWFQQVLRQDLGFRLLAAKLLNSESEEQLVLIRHVDRELAIDLASLYFACGCESIVFLFLDRLQGSQVQALLRLGVLSWILGHESWHSQFLLLLVHSD